MKFFKLTTENADKYFAVVTALMSVMGLILIAFMVTIIITQYNELPKFFFLMVGLIIGLEIQQRLNKKRNDQLQEIIDGYKKMMDDIFGMFRKADAEVKAKEAQKARVKAARQANMAKARAARKFRKK